MSHSLSNTDSEKIIFQRLTFKGHEDWDVATCDQVIVSTRLHLEGIIGDIEGQAEVDFANENVGFGQTGTQVGTQSRIKEFWGSCYKKYLVPLIKKFEKLIEFSK